MKLSRTTVATAFSVFPVVFVAGAGHGGDSDADRARLDVRQAGASASGSLTTSPSTSAPAAVTGTFSVHSTNPTAFPLSVITKDEPSVSTRPLDRTAAPGAVPTSIPHAPVLPNAAALRPADYPALDKVPPVDSEQVQKWIQEVKDTGVVIPEFEATNPGGCSNNSAFAADPERCWWTCGGCTRSTDIVECPAAMDWGLTYDDGPSPYTPDLLAYLDEVKLKSTFFVVGSRVISYPEILQAEHMAGHQIAVHTWSHAPLTALTDAEIVAELGWTKKVIKDVLGVTPNMMRPPTGDIDDRVRAISLAMELTPVMWSRAGVTTTFDTDDFNIQSGKTTVQQVLQNWGSIITGAASRSSGFIVLAHDLYEQTVQVATGYILPDALAHRPPFNIQPVISCLSKDMKEAYAETADVEKNPPTVSEAVASGDVTLTGSAAGAENTANTNTSSATYISFGFGGWLSFVITSFVGMTASGRLLV